MSVGSRLESRKSCQVEKDIEPQAGLAQAYSIVHSKDILSEDIRLLGIQ
jgi:hypothetical protein